MAATDASTADPENGPLGITAKSSSPSRSAARALRYQAHSHGREMLRAAALAESPDRWPGDVFRTVDCRNKAHSDIGVYYSSAHESAHYGGLVTCGSVWACPICASRIQERRRLEIEQAIQWAHSHSLVPVLVTFTFPHRSWHSLRDLIHQQRAAFKRLRSGKAWMSVKPVGLIRSLEVTHGANGWHPHTHELWFCDSQSLPDLRRLVTMWERSCSRAGLLDPNDSGQLRAFRAHGVDIQVETCAKAGDYLAKIDDSRSWGFAHEVGKAASKAGRAKGVHPHHFLIRRAAGDAANFVEYVRAMKGARQLFWSPGLKAKAGIGEVTDEELADETREPADLLGRLSPEDWDYVRGNDARAELLDAAETGGWSAVRHLLRSLGAP